MDFYYKHKNYKLKLSKDMEEYLKVMQKEFMPEYSKMDAIMGIEQEETGDFIVNEKDETLSVVPIGNFKPLS